eukprot:m.572919 g.572919  ORF g.572919 m.572919 type:complete len:76 (-) comp57871_c0_seq7:128-355(-)
MPTAMFSPKDLDLIPIQAVADTGTGIDRHDTILSDKTPEDSDFQSGRNCGRDAVDVSSELPVSLCQSVIVWVLFF